MRLSLANRPPAAAVLGGTAVVLVIGLLVGFNLLTAPFGEADAGPTCRQQTVEPGEALTRNLVRVDVYNGSNKSGLANRISVELQRRGFLEGDVANNTSDYAPRWVAIFSETPDNDPAAELVLRQFPRADIIKPKSDTVMAKDAVTVLIGPDFNGDLKRDAESEIKLKEPLTVCVPLVAVS